MLSNYSDYKDIISLDNLENSNILVKNFTGENISLSYKENSKNTLFYYEPLNGNTNLNITLLENTELNIKIILLNDDFDLNINVDLNGSYATCIIDTLALAKNSHKNINVNMKHNAVETVSKVNNYGISFDNGKLDYDIVGSISQNKTHADVSQITRGLLLSPTGYCKVKPVLLIDYYDVKAYHGATIGKISDDDLFYLMSRGLTKSESYMLVVNGVITPYLENIDESLKNEIYSKYQTYFTGE